MIKKAREFLHGVMVEMKKVTWPDRDQLINSTIVVFVVSALFTIYIFLVDSIVSRIVKIFYQ
ncbi:MAG: preprotein translocase subunit SecE [Calditrichaeota bacterium]|nr:MAG: preprotein translocase subunit SecE [Calditrichota bacterium]